MKSATVVPEVMATSTSRSTSIAPESARPTGVSAGAVTRPGLMPETPRPFGTLNAETARAFAVAAHETRPFARIEPGVKPQRVLLVDDSRSIRTLLKIYLMARAFEYIEAESAEAALAELEKQPVDLILTDFHMDGMNGADFAAAVRAHKDTKVTRIPILMMTGDANAAEVRNKGQKAGINAFVRKPVSCAQLMTLVDTILPAPKKE
ncbi:Chemotaxis regulator/flagelllar motor components CheY [Cystobacter fuscus DSM 2262]|uniref:Chemotaxis regulator/flagelllar motor components CheY n=1 Tax=Cystobacter fuscus (strain ATCC 25194 / DSM 2262 / NBRC 100088 / M29) TaxID=1242864 RepID=S9QV55_CYSF2|nr:response regulator [Cystobacter fuscus]EPX65219.1 Chemotaxis regulator/flagelllar motor components CheY [Cystobacter fuscus DSM 2262]